MVRNVGGGFQPDTKSPSARRADFDLQRRINKLARTGGGGDLPAEGGDPGEVLTVNPDGDPEWLPPTGGGGGTGTDEVWIGTTDPIAAHPTLELWFDPDAEPDGGGGGEQAMSYVHHQGTVSDTWVIDHNLGWYPNVIVEDSGGSTVEGDIAFDTTDRLTLTFSGAFSGIAYLS